MSELIKNVFLYITQKMCIKIIKVGLWGWTMSLISIKPRRCLLKQLKKINGGWKTSLINVLEICDNAVACNPYTLRFVPDHFKTQEMCIEAVCRVSLWLDDVADHLRTQEMCDVAVPFNPYMSDGAPDCLKTQKTCDKPVAIYTYQISDESLINLRLKKCVIR